MPNTSDGPNLVTDRSLNFERDEGLQVERFYVIYGISNNYITVIEIRF